MARRIGEASITQGINVNIPLSGIRELDIATTNFQQAVSSFSHTSQPQHNPYYNNIPWAGDVLPSAPPAYEFSSMQVHQMVNEKSTYSTC
jgi:hypothetical protein